MAFDFARLLVLLTAIGTAIWIAEILWLRKARRTRAALENRPELDQEPWWVDWTRSFLPVLILVLILRSFVFEPFKIPSESMVPSLLVGDFIVVNKFAYGLRLPVTHTRILKTGTPKRGDVVVFRFPRDPSQNYIKRVVGLPGDTIDLRGRQLFVNGESISHTAVGKYTRLDSKCARTPGNEQRPGPYGEWTEYLDDTAHAILLQVRGAERPARQWIVPEDAFFVMGDNRDNSSDSRVWGFVPEANLVGRAERIWLNWDLEQGCLDWSRVGDDIMPD